MTDWSKTGIGFVLYQKHCKCATMEKVPHCGEDHWKLVFAGSRFTNDAESRYAPFEGEVMALVYGLESTRMYMLGNDKLFIGLDHNHGVAQTRGDQEPQAQIVQRQDIDVG